MRLLPALPQFKGQTIRGNNTISKTLKRTADIRGNTAARHPLRLYIYLQTLQI